VLSWCFPGVSPVFFSPTSLSLSLSLSTHRANYSSSSSPPSPFSVNTILPLNPLEPLLALGQILGALGHLLRLVVEDDEVAVHEVEAVELVAGLLGVGHLVVDDEGGALGGGGVALADLAHGAEFGEEGEEGRWVEVVAQVFYEEDAGDGEGDLVWEGGRWEGRGWVPVGFWGKLVGARHCGVEENAFSGWEAGGWRLDSLCVDVCVLSDE